MKKVKCPTKNLMFILPLVHENSLESLEGLLNNPELEPIITAKVLPYGKNKTEIRYYLQKHIPNCKECLANYNKFLAEESDKNNQPVYELEQEYLNLELN